jgi:hypothetical protein
MQTTSFSYIRSFARNAGQRFASNSVPAKRSIMATKVYRILTARSAFIAGPAIGTAHSHSLEIPNAQTSLSVPDPAGYIRRKIDA